MIDLHADGELKDNILVEIPTIEDLFQNTTVKKTNNRKAKPKDMNSNKVSNSNNYVSKSLIDVTSSRVNSIGGNVNVRNSKYVNLDNELNDSKNDVEEDDNETTSFMASKSSKRKISLNSRAGTGRKSLYECWKDDYDDNSYEDDKEHENFTKEQLASTCIKGGFERAFVALFDQDIQTFTGSMLLNLDQIEKQFGKEEFQKTRSIDAFRALMTQFQTFINFQYYFDDFDGTMICKKSILERAKHKREKDRRVNGRMMQSKERKDNSSNALDADLVVTESNETQSERHVLSSRFRNDMHTNDADINSVNDKQPMAEVQLSVEHILANEQQHSEQSESIYDTYLLEKIDRNTTPKSTDMSHRGGEIDQNTYKDLSDFIKKTSVQTKDLANSLIVQLNCKTVENADLKVQIQEKVFANAALKNELRKSKGNSVDTKFTKLLILGKPVLQLPRNQSVVRQLDAFKSEQPNSSKPRFAFQVDVNNILSKPITPHYLPKVRESASAKPHHVNAPSSSRNSKKE
nr:hypothetical protein [Tanacetum cinerariifolium]